MPTVLQFRRGTTTQNNNFLGADGEVTVDTQSQTVRLHDGTTLGGIVLGDRGYTGSTGAGYTGSAGTNGYTGSIGYTGSAGITGTTGAAGTTGYTGSSGDKYQTVSVTSFALGTSGNQTITVQTGLNYSTGQSISLAYDVNNIQYADIVSYTTGSGSLTFQRTAIKGSGTYATWVVNLLGAVGALGYTGSAGYVGSAGISSTGTITFSTNTISGASNTDVTISPDGTGKVNVNSHKIINLTDPTADQDAATKKYVDDTTSDYSTSGFALAMAIAL